MALPLALIGGVLKGVFGFIKPFLAPLLAFWKGKREGHAKAKAEANEHFIETTNRITRDRDAAAAQRLHGDTDDDAHFRD